MQRVETHGVGRLLHPLSPRQQQPRLAQSHPQQVLDWRAADMLCEERGEVTGAHVDMRGDIGKRQPPVVMRLDVLGRP
ncbi:MAG TPA: hypothetical protein DGT21_04265 [Armatimonadetes bacterium]|nr:hypothetical protein [Armatimonadota bacterium]